MAFIAFLFGMVMGLTIAVSIALVSIYNILYHSVPPEELRAFVKELRTALRVRNRRKK